MSSVPPTNSNSEPAGDATGMLAVREHLSNQGSRRSSRTASATNCLDPKIQYEQLSQRFEEEVNKGTACDTCKMPFDEKAHHSHEGHDLCDVCFDVVTALTCNACKGPINCFSQNHKYFSSKDGRKNWHDYCIKCSICRALLVSESKRFKMNDAIFCAMCFDRKTGISCANCKLPIYRKSQGQKLVVSKDKTKSWHVYCLVCYGCGKNLARQPYYCHEAGGTFCAECYDVKIGDNCARCKKLIKCISQHEQKCVLSDGTIWHDYCLRCDDCHVNLGNKRLFHHEKSVLCAVCYDAKTAYLCINCKRPINVNSEGHQKYSSKDGLQNWHEHCLLCWQCNRPLAGKTLHWRDNRMFCALCRNNSANFRTSAMDQVMGNNGL